MVTTLGRVVAVVALLAVVYAGWRWLSTSEEDRVRAAIEALTDTLSAPARDPLAQVTALGRLRQHLTVDVVVSTPGGAAVQGRDAAAAAWQRVRASAGGEVRVRVLDLMVTLGADGVSAEADGVAEITRDRDGAPERSLHEVQASFDKVDGEWRLARAATVEAVQPPR